MNLFTIYEKNNNFSMSMISDLAEELNNELALNKRFCLIFIEKGSGIIEINTEPMPFIAPILFCINEREHIKIDKSLGLKIKIIYFHPKVINSVFNFQYIRNIPVNCPITILQDWYWNKYFINRNNKFFGVINIGPITYKKLEYLFNIFRRETTYQDRENWSCRSRSYLMEILFLIENVYIESHNVKNQFLGEADENLYPILLYIFNNYDKKITVTELTKLFNINRTTLSAKFHDHVGESLITYINKLRIHIASIIIIDTKLPISEIMLRVGFSDSTHFLRTFKKYAGMTPTEYRDRYCWM